MKRTGKQLNIMDCFSRFSQTKTPSTKVHSDAGDSCLVTPDVEPPPSKLRKVSDENNKENKEASKKCVDEKQGNYSKSEAASAFVPLPPSSPIPKKLNFSKSFGDLVRASLVEPGWRRVLQQELQKPYMNKIFDILNEADKKQIKIFPPRHLIFNAFNLTPFRKVSVVLIGQDPYHNDGQAHGLCFSVPRGIFPPPSLKNIYKELETEYEDFRTPNHGCLEAWAAQGVFMLNATLTVEAHKANSHSQIGWQIFTDAVIRIVSTRAEKPCVFLLWGGFAHKKEALIDTKRHRVIKTAHPSPLSYRLFQGSKCFQRTNEALVALNREPINWNCLSNV